MKFLKFAVAALLFPMFLLSCSKDNDTASPVEGKWQGLYGNDGGVPSYLYRLNVRHGGVIEELNSAGMVKGSGSWNFSGNTFTAHYQWKAPLNTVFTIKATYDPSTNKLTGTWGFDDDATDGGTWNAGKTE